MNLTDQEILDIFYNDIIPNASVGKIDCYFSYNIFFDTNLEGRVITSQTTKDTSETIKPILNIENQENFNHLLLLYVKEALNFYNDDSYPELDEMLKEGTSKEKVILTLLWSNANYIDFENPCEFIKRRILYLKNCPPITSYMTNTTELMQNGKIEFLVQPDILCMETPYKLMISTINSEGQRYYFPELKFGIQQDTIDIYAMQMTHENTNQYAKKLNRLFYKIGTSSHENLNDITASFLIAATIATSFFKMQGYDTFSINDFLIERWNAKRIMINNKIFSNPKHKEEQLLKQEAIQNNLTQKILYTFARLADEFEGIDVIGIPTELNPFLNIKVENEVKSDKKTLNDLFEIVYLSHEEKKKKQG